MGHRSSPILPGHQSRTEFDPFLRCLLGPPEPIFGVPFEIPPPPPARAAPDFHGIKEP